MAKIFKVGNVNGISLWVDDERDPTDPEIQSLYGSKGDELWVKKYDDAISILKTDNVKMISFDHDLGEDIKDGHDIASWIEEEAYFGRISPIRWRVHSSNPKGSERIMMAMKNADRFWGSRK
jgi:hypothetical protein